MKKMETNAYNPIPHIRIAIDGFSGCGKSSLAKCLAQKFNFNYIDTGALYRLATFVLKNDHVINEEDMSFLRDVEMLPNGTIMWNGENYCKELSEKNVIDRVSIIAQNNVVRKCINEWISANCDEKSVIMVGRDIGTVVMPDAELKLFLYGSIEERMARWRKGELARRGVIAPQREMAEREDLKKRDFNDINRTISPLTCPKDAIVFNIDKVDDDSFISIVSEMIMKRLNTK